MIEAQEKELANEATDVLNKVLFILGDVDGKTYSKDSLGIVGINVKGIPCNCGNCKSAVGFGIIVEVTKETADIVIEEGTELHYLFNRIGGIMKSIFFSREEVKIVTVALRKSNDVDGTVTGKVSYTNPIKQILELMKDEIDDELAEIDVELVSRARRGSSH